MKEIRFLTTYGLDVDGTARGFVKGDVRDYIPEDTCEYLVNAKIAEYVKPTVKKEPKPKAEEKRLNTQREDKLMKPAKKADK